MNMTTNRMSPVTSISTTCETEQDIKNWSQYSQGIAAAMSKRMAELGLTQQMLAEKMNCTQQYISKVLKEAVKLALPILAAEVLGEIGMGILMKAIPQINAFVINMELKVIIGLVLLFVFLTPFNEFLLQAEAQMLTEMEQAVRLLGTGG